MPLSLALVVMFAFQVSRALAEPDWVIYDDDELDTTATSGAEEVQYAVRFTPPFYPCKLIAAKFYINWYPTWLPPGYPLFRVHVTDVDHNDLITPFDVGRPTDAYPLWLTVDLSAYNLIIESGDFMVSVEFLRMSDNPVFGVDTDSPIDERSYTNCWIGWGWTLLTDWDFMIRAEVVPTPGAPVPEFEFSVPVVASASAALYLFVKQRLIKKR